MKQFIYLDIDIVTSIIAQAEKGLVTQVTSEQEKGTSDERTKTISADAAASGGGKLFNIIKADAQVSLEGEFSTTASSNSSSKDIVEKIFHDASFDVACQYIDFHKPDFGDQSFDNEGEYLELKRVFDFADFDYLEGMVGEDGIIEFTKKASRQQIDENFAQMQEGIGRDQLRKMGNQIKQNINKAKKLSDKQYDDFKDLVKLSRKVIPYSRMMISQDGYLIPLDDKYFRIDPSSLGFKFGGEMTCVGMVTNIILDDFEEDEKSDEDHEEKKNPFSSIQSMANNALRSFFPTVNNSLCVIHPIAVYYGE